MGDVVWFWTGAGWGGWIFDGAEHRERVLDTLGDTPTRVGSTNVGPPDDGPDGEPIDGVTRARCEDCGDTLPYGDRGVCDFCVAR